MKTRVFQLSYERDGRQDRNEIVPSNETIIFCYEINYQQIHFQHDFKLLYYNRRVCLFKVPNIHVIFKNTVTVNYFKRS